MIAIEYVEKKKKQKMEKQVIKSIQSKDFFSAFYLDKQIKEMFKKDKNISNDFKKFF